MGSHASIQRTLEYSFGSCALLSFLNHLCENSVNCICIYIYFFATDIPIDSKYTGLCDFQEELQMQVDICEYDLHYAALSLPSKDAQVGVLTVPGASEYRPACLFGDIVRVRVPCTQRVNGAAKVAPACYEFQVRSRAACTVPLLWFAPSSTPAPCNRQNFAQTWEQAAIVDRKKSDQVIIVLDTKNLHEICASDHSVVVHVRFNYPSRGVMLMRRALDVRVAEWPKPQQLLCRLSAFGHQCLTLLSLIRFC